MSDSLYDFKSQSIGLESVANARDLGGYLLPDGRTVRKGLLLRGGTLAKLGNEDRDTLLGKYRLSKIFDFRTESEVVSAPDRNLPGVSYTWLPAIDPETEKIDTLTLPHEAYSNLPVYLVDQGNAFNPSVQGIARHIYSEMVLNEYTQLQYAAFMQIIVSAGKGSVYWHCSQGKDRTGLGSAFLLSALGADRKLIMEDFDISNDFYRNDIDSLLAKLHEKGNDIEADKVIKTFIGCNTEYFSKALDLIDYKFGSMANYLHGPLCLSDEDIEILKNRYLE